MVHHRLILTQLLQREIKSRYRGSILGLSWPFVQLALQIALFLLIFYEIMNVRWPTPTIAANYDNHYTPALQYASQLFAGLGVFNFVAEILGRAPSCIVMQPNFVTRIRFPLHLLPLVVVFASLVHFLVTIAGLFVIRSITIGWTIESLSIALLVPLILLPLFLYCLAASFFLSSVGVFLRDVSILMPSISLGLMFLSPIFYPIESAPALLQEFLRWNPLGPSIELIRAVFVNPDVGDQFRILEGFMLVWVVHFSVASILLLFFFRLFLRLREGFADAI